MSKQRTSEREDFMLKGNLSELEWTPRTEDQISQDLFKGTNPDKLIDAYEEQLGLKNKPQEKANTAYKCVFLSPCSEPADADLLQKFYNCPDQYQVMNRSDYWTPRGELKIFLEYQENLDVKKKKDQMAANTEE